MDEAAGPASSDASELSPWERAALSFTRWRAGDATAVDDLIRLMTPVLWHVVRAYRHDKETAEDVVQATWVTFLRAHDTISDPQAVSRWLIVTARREAARAAERGRRSVAVEDESLARRLPDDVSAESVAMLDDEATRLWRAVGTLDERCRKLLRVVAFDDRPDYASLTRELHMPIGSIGPTRSRCLGKLRRALAPEDAP